MSMEGSELFGVAFQLRCIIFSSAKQRKREVRKNSGSSFNFRSFDFYY